MIFMQYFIENSVDIVLTLVYNLITRLREATGTAESTGKAYPIYG